MLPKDERTRVSRRGWLRAAGRWTALAAVGAATAVLAARSGRPPQAGEARRHGCEGCRWLSRGCQGPKDCRLIEEGG